jgi:hypothetical protein
MASPITDQFKGLPIGELIANPLIAAAQAQGKLAGITQQFIEEVGLEKDGDQLKARTVDFNYDAIVEKKTGEAGSETTTTTVEPRSIKVPLLSIVNTPNLSVKEVTIDFDMKVQSTSMHKDSTDVNVTTKASVGSKSENTRSTDNSARYTVHCQARDDGAPEGLMKVLDILGESIKPTPKGGAEGGDGGGDGK